MVVFDALANTGLLNEAPAAAERIDVGKRAGDRPLSQDRINRLLVEKAQGGRLVVRLKGGDPFVFGRGAEEVVYVASQGVPCEVVPGVTAGLAVPATAGIPVTHRRMASTVTLVTGHEDPAKGPPWVDYGALATLVRTGGTVCFYMGAAQLSAITARLRNHGLSADTPAAVIQWGTLPQQRSTRSSLAQASEDANNAQVGSPAIIVVGTVAALQEPGLDWFTRRPLFGQRVVITRPRHQARALRQALEELGAVVLESPTIVLEPPDDWSGVDQSVRELDRFDWLVLTSANGVVALDERMDQMGLDGRHLATVKIAVIGDATAAALRDHLGVRADLVPDHYVAEALAQDLITKHGVKQKQMLILRADIARPALPRLLADAGALVTELVLYRTRPAPALPADVHRAMQDGTVDWITFTSSSTAVNMAQLLGNHRNLLSRVKIASIGPITSSALRGVGLSPTVEAVTSNIGGLVDAMIEAVSTPPAS